MELNLFTDDEGVACVAARGHISGESMLELSKKAFPFLNVKSCGVHYFFTNGEDHVSDLDLVDGIYDEDFKCSLEDYKSEFEEVTCMEINEHEFNNHSVKIES
jgi:hypothetical protein